MSSSLLRVAPVRAIRRAEAPSLLAKARRHLRAIHCVALDDETLDRAAALDPLTRRSLDAIHLASAMTTGDDLAVLVTYDERLGEAATALDLPRAAPA